MGNTLTSTEWLILILLVVFIVIINISLFKRMKSKPGRENWVSRITEAGRTLKDPFHDETQKMQELSSRVEQLNSKTGINYKNEEVTSNSGEKNE